MDKQHGGGGVWTSSMEGLVYEEAAWRGWCRDKQHGGDGVWTNSMEGVVYGQVAWRGWCMKKQQGGAVVKRDLLHLFCPTCPFMRYNSAWHGIQ